MVAEKFFAGGDIGLVSDSSALAIVGLNGREITLRDLLELRPEKGRPLKLSAVIGAFAERLATLGLRSFTADGWCREPAREYTKALGIYIEDAPEGAAGKTAAYLATRDAMREGRLALGVNLRLRAQLRSIVSAPTSGGGLKISAPRRGGHADLVSALVLAVHSATINAGYCGIPRPPNRGGNEGGEGGTPRGAGFWGHNRRGF